MNTTSSTIGNRKRRPLGFAAAGSLLLLAALLLVPPAAHAQVHFTNCASGTGSNAIVGIAFDIVTTGSFTPETGDEIAAFRPDGSLCAGTEIYDSTANIAVTVWGNNALTNPTIDGMLSGEEMQWRIWDASADIEYFANVTYNSNAPFIGSGAFADGGLYQLLSLVPGEPTAVSLISAGTSAETPPLLPLLLAAALAVLTIIIWRTARRPTQK